MPTDHKVADIEDLSSDGSRVIAEIDGVEVAVFRIDGEYHALANYCVHAGGPLCEGPLAGRVTADPDGWTWDFDDSERIVVCPWHSWKFDVTTGRCVDADRYAVPTYDVTVTDGEVFVRR